MMKTKVISFLLVVVLSFGCEKNIECENRVDENKGDIIQSLDFECFFQLPNDQIVIESTENFRIIANDLGWNTTNCNPPSIDFKKNSLIGLTTQGTGCSRSYLRSFEEKGDKNYLYKVTVRECGNCKPLEFKNNLVLVPKIKEGWTVSFETKTTVN